MKINYNIDVTVNVKIHLFQIYNKKISDLTQISN